MKIVFNDQNRKITFFILVLIIVISIFFVNNIGNKQDSVYQEETNQYKYALKLLNDNKMNEAAPILAALVEKHNSNSEIIRAYSIVLQKQQKYEEAAKMLQKAQDINIYLIKDSTFLAQYGEVLFMLGDYAKSKVYLEESAKLNPEPKILEAVDSLLSKIELIQNKE